MATNDIYIPTITEVREEMRRHLSTEERSAYRGITRSGMTGIKLKRLIGVKNAEELILAQRNGRQFIPSDDPQNVYYVSVGRGVVAQYDPEYIAAMYEEEGGPGPASSKSLSEWDKEYRDMQPLLSPEEEEVEAEELLNQVAKNYITWVEEVLGSKVKGD